MCVDFEGCRHEVVEARLLGGSSVEVNNPGSRTHISPGNLRGSVSSLCRRGDGCGSH